jgi:benzoyl-CoA 2,3-dioxygenase component B
VIADAGIAFELKLPHRAFNRRIGAFNELHVSPDGKVVSAGEWKANAHKWLPTDEDRAYVTSLMGKAVVEPGKFANWIAPPQHGINRQPANFEYVRVN